MKDICINNTFFVKVFIKIKLLISMSLVDVKSTFSCPILTLSNDVHIKVVYEISK